MTMSSDAPTPDRAAGPVPALALGAMVLAVGASWLRWPTSSGGPAGWSLVALGLLVVAMAAVVARRAAPAPWAATGAGLAALLTVGRGLTAFGELAHDRVGAEPGPALLLAAALVGVAQGASTLGAGRVAPAGRRPLALALGLALAAGGVTAGRLGLAADPFARPSFRPASLLAEASNQGLVRPSVVVPGELVAVAGPYVMTEAAAVGGRRLEVRDGRTGRPVWSVVGPGPDPVVRATADEEGFVVLADGGPVRYAAATGVVQWSADLGGGRGLAVTTEGIATLAGDDTDVAVVVLDAISGRERRRIPASCGNAELVEVRVPTVRCGPVDESSRVRVFGGATSAPSYAGLGVKGETGIVDAGPGLLAVGDPTAARSIVEAATGTVRFPVSPGAVVLDSPDPAVVLLLTGPGTDVLERRDATTGALLGATTLDGGAELDARPDRRSVRSVRGGRLLQTSPRGLGTARSPAGERQLGVVAWDLATGARVERSVGGPVVGELLGVRATRVVLGRDLVATGVVPPGAVGSWVVLYTVDRI